MVFLKDLFLCFFFKLISVSIITGLVDLPKAESSPGVFLCGHLFPSKKISQPSTPINNINPFKSEKTSIDSKIIESARIFHGKWGGSSRLWERFMEKLSNEKSYEEFSEIQKTLMEVEKAPWLTRTKNSLFFMSVLGMFRTIQAHHVTEMDLHQLKSWRQLNVNERRALLLFNFKKWWWDVNSDHLEGFTQWLRPSFIISEILLGKTPRGRLSHRLHELLGSDANLSFFSNLFNYFASEIQIFRSVENNPASRQTLVKSLKTRLTQLRRFREIYKNQLRWSQKHYLKMAIQRSEVLVKLLEENSTVNEKEFMELLGINSKETYGLRTIRILIVTNDFIMQAAVLVAFGYLVESFFDERIESQVITGSFNDFFNKESKKRPY